MDAIEFDEDPSAVRNRLSVALSNNARETAEDLRYRRPSSALQWKSKDDQAEAHADDSSAVGREQTWDRRKSWQMGRASVTGRRLSTFSRVFALSSTSLTFIKQDLRPTFINAMLFFLDPNPNVEKIRRVLSERLLDIPRFRSTLNQNNYTESVYWEPIPRSAVDLRYHVRVLDGKGTFDGNDIENLISNEFMTDWFITKPLWRMVLVKNLKGGRSMLFCVIDHAVGDELAIIGAITSLLDDPPSGSDEVKSQQQPHPQAQSPNWSHRTARFLEGVFKGVLWVVAPPTDPHSSLKIPKDRLHEECPGKTFHQTKPFSLTDINSMKDKLPGVTLNDVVLAILTIAFRRFIEDTGDSIIERIHIWEEIRAEVQVNMRCQASTKKAITNAGNDFATASFAFPLNYRDPIDAVWKCKTRAEDLKHSPGLHIKKILSRLILRNSSDESIAQTVTEGANRPTCVVSNVVIPQQVSRMAGYELDHLSFTTSFLGSLYLGVISYNDELRISIVLDKRTEADGSKLKECLESAYDDLRSAIVQADKAGGLDPPVVTPGFLEYLIYIAAIAFPVLLALHLK